MSDKGLDFVIIEKNADVGGTWWENTYPGCGVDTPNHAYSYSFGAVQRWSRYFAPQAEIHAYLTKKADEFDVRRHMQFNTFVQEVNWQEEAQLQFQLLCCFHQ